MENQYWMMGDISIPEEKRAEFNENVLKLLRLGGIRRQKETVFGGRTLTVVQEPEPDEAGIVRFDYSVFERWQRTTAEYDTNTCALMAPDRGYGEYALVMNMVMTMQEAYSQKPCFFMREDRLCDIRAYALLIERMTGLKLSFSKRGKTGIGDLDDFHASWTEAYGFYKAIQRDNEDEFLEFEYGRELYLSEDMKENLKDWKRKYQEADAAAAEAVSMETYLADILRELEEIWGCRYISHMMVKEFLEHADDIRYRKAVFICRQFLDEILQYFPELTPEQVKEWILRKCRRKRDSRKLEGYMSLLTNRMRRSEVLGF